MRKMGPLIEFHPLIKNNDKCPACNIPFRFNDYVTIIPLGPGNDPEAQRQAREGHPYNAVGSVVHWSCATGEIDG